MGRVARAAVRRCPFFFAIVPGNMTRRGRWIVIGVAAVIGLAFAALTPPFEVSDEVFHFYRPVVIAQGQLLPERRGEPDAAMVPDGVKDLVYVMLTQRNGERYSVRQLREAAAIPLQVDRQKPIRFPSWYTPVAYVPQTIAAAVGLRPLIYLYLGRILNLACALMLVFAAMRIAPDHAGPLAAAALLPMTLSQFASLSADALTIALAFLLTAMLLAERVSAGTIVVAFLAALCKPGYFLVALLVLAARARPWRKAAVIGASVAGTALAFGYARLAWYVQRMNDPIDPAAQLRCMLSDPSLFVRAVANNFSENARGYLEGLVGRFGGVQQVSLPFAIVLAEAVVLLLAGLTAAPLSRMKRLLGAAIVVASCFGIVLSQYLTWSFACSDVLQGLQGRYALPLLPLALAPLALPRPRWRAGWQAIVAVALIANAVALLRISRHFW
jgi:uncharacterized membrane protein